MIRLINKYLMYIIFVITPTTIGMFLHLTFNNKFPAGGIFIFFLLIFIVKFRLKYTKIHFWILLYLLINIVYFLFSILYFDDFSNDILKDNLIIFIMSVLVPFTTFVFYSLIIRYRINIKRFIFFVSLGTIFLNIMNISTYYVVDTILGRANTYEVRDEIYRLTEKLKEEKEKIELPKIQKIPFEHFTIMGGTTGMGPLSALLGVLLVIFGITNKSKFIFIIGIFSLITTIFMVSRSSMISIVIGIITYFLVNLYIKDKRKFIVGITCSFIMMFILLIVVISLSSDINIFQKFQPDRLFNEPRLQIWGGILYLTAINPFGYGFDYIRIAHEFSPSYMASLGIDYTHAHNAYLNVLINFGVIGFFIFIMMLYTIIKETFKNIVFYKYKNKIFYHMSIALFCALITSYVHFMFEDLFLTYETIYGGTFWLMVTIVNVLVYYRKFYYIRGVKL